MPRPNPFLSLSADEFHVMPHLLGWEHEYWDGAPRLSPSKFAVADFELTVDPGRTPCRPVREECELRKVGFEEMLERQAHALRDTLAVRH